MITDFKFCPMKFRSGRGSLEMSPGDALRFPGIVGGSARYMLIVHNREASTSTDVIQLADGAGTVQTEIAGATAEQYQVSDDVILIAPATNAAAVTCLVAETEPWELSALSPSKFISVAQAGAAGVGAAADSAAAAAASAPAGTTPTTPTTPTSGGTYTEGGTRGSHH